MNGFIFDFSKIFWKGTHRAPSSDPSSVFSLASPSVWALSSFLGRFTHSIRSSPSTQLLFGDFGLAPQNKFLDPPCSGTSKVTQLIIVVSKSFGVMRINNPKESLHKLHQIVFKLFLDDLLYMGHLRVSCPRAHSDLATPLILTPDLT